jgi:hypothetical protein
LQIAVAVRENATAFLTLDGLLAAKYGGLLDVVLVR